MIPRGFSSAPKKARDFNPAEGSAKPLCCNLQIGGRALRPPTANRPPGC